MHAALIPQNWCVNMSPMIYPSVCQNSFCGMSDQALFQILIFQAKIMPSTQSSKSDPDSDGQKILSFGIFNIKMLSLCLSDFCNGVATDIIEAVSALDDENICPGSQLTTPATDAASGEGWLLCNF